MKAGFQSYQTRKHSLRLNPVFRKMILLAPPGARMPGLLNQEKVYCDGECYEDYLAEAPALRARRTSGLALPCGRGSVRLAVGRWHLGPQPKSGIR